MIIQPLRKTSPIPFFLFILWLTLYLSHATQNLMCFSEEKEALLEFKRGIQMDHCGFLSSWGNRKLNEGCCQWHGILCDNQTDHVIGINLNGAKADSDRHCLEGLQILDVSVNQISGNIPSCIYNLTAMTTTSDLLPDILYQYDFSVVMSYYDAAFVMWKRKEQIFKNSLGQVKFIHMSDNVLEGEIPHGISNLVGLVSLDLSRNMLNGSITPKMGQLAALELLDLSNNHLSGKIPTTFANLNFLGMLNLSYNNLSGRIPIGTLLQGFDASSYTGNPELCGAPLAKSSGDQPPSSAPSGDYNSAEQDVNNSDDIFPGLYISVVLGFIIGF